MNESNSREESRGLLIGGLIVLGVGTFFLLRNLGIIPDMGQMWPVFPIIVGLSMIVGALKGRRRP